MTLISRRNPSSANRHRKRGKEREKKKNLIKGRRKKGFGFSIFLQFSSNAILYIGKWINFIYLSSRLLSLLGEIFWDSISWRLINLFCSVIWLEKLEGVGRTWKASIEQNQSQEARCQLNVMKTYPPGLGRLLPSRDERRPRKRKSEVKRNVWWPPNIDAIFLILFLRSSPSPMENLLSRSIDLNKK